MIDDGRPPRIAGVGHVALDMVFELDTIPQQPVKVAARALRRVVGGMTANACVAAARLGATMRIVPSSDHHGRARKQRPRRRRLRLLSSRRRRRRCRRARTATTA